MNGFDGKYTDDEAGESLIGIDVLSMISHEIRTFLNIIIGMANIASCNQKDVCKINDCLKKIDFSSRNLMSIVNNVLDLEKIENDKFNINNFLFDINGLAKNIYDAVVIQTEEKGIYFSVYINGFDRGFEYLGDATRINQVIMNLCSNAVKYTNENGRILLQIEKKSSRALTDVVAFSVVDNGVGMSREMLASLFQPFVRENDIAVNKCVGSGIGLCICKKLVGKLKGSLRVFSEKGEGTKCVVTLPLIRNSVLVNNNEYTFIGNGCQKDSNGEALINGKRFLVAEDNELGREIIFEMLLAAGGLVDAVENGKEAVEKFAGAGNGYYDAVIMDMEMPIIDGIAATEIIRKSNLPYGSRVPIVSVSANVFPWDVDKAFKAGVNEHINKPFDREQLYGKLSELFKQKE